MKILRRLGCAVLTCTMLASVGTTAFAKKVQNDVTVTLTEKFDTDTPTIALGGSFGSSLKPQYSYDAKKNTNTTKSLRFIYPQNTGTLDTAARAQVPLASYMGTKVNVVSFDVNILKAANISMGLTYNASSLKADGREEALISSKGKIFHRNNAQYNNNTDVSYWFNSDNWKENNKEFTFNDWHNITLVQDITNISAMKTRLYLDSQLVTSSTDGLVMNWGNSNALRFVCYSPTNANETVFDLDNLKVGHMESIPADADLTTTGYLSGVTYTVNDTYEDETTPTISTESLKPVGGSTKVMDGKNYARIIYKNNSSRISESLRFSTNAENMLTNSGYEFVSFDVNVTKPADIIISEEAAWNNRSQFYIDSSGYLAQYMGKSTYSGKDVNPFAEKTDEEIKEESYGYANFTFNEWHNIKMDFDRPDNSYKLYLDGVLVTTKPCGNQWGLGSDRIEISNLSKTTLDKEGIIELTNVKFGNYRNAVSKLSAPVDGDGVEAATFTNGDSRYVPYTVDEGVVTTVYVLCAKYDENGVLTSIEPIPVDGSATAKVDGQVELENIPEGIKKIKVFMWSNLTGASPLTSYQELNYEE